MAFSYSYIDTTQPTQLPARKVNGGLYTGDKAAGDWGNYPVLPESHILTTKNLLTAGPPQGAIQQPVSTLRPGNNHVIHPYHVAPPSLNGMYIDG